MALAVTVTATDKTQKLLHVYGKIVPSGSYTSGGDTFSLAKLADVAAQGLPLYVRIWSAHPAASGSPPSPQTNLFVYEFAVGTTLANGVMQVYTGAAAQTALTELSAGAYPAGVTADTINFEAAFYWGI